MKHAELSIEEKAKKYDELIAHRRELRKRSRKKNNAEKNQQIISNFQTHYLIDNETDSNEKKDSNEEKDNKPKEESSKEN